MLCSNCGTPVNETDKFCPECGTPIERPDIQEQTAAATAAAEEMRAEERTAIPIPQPAPAPKKKSHKALWIVLICVALAAVIAVALFVWRPWSKCGARENLLNEGTPAHAAENAPASPAVPLTPEEAVRAAFEKNQTLQSMHTEFNESVVMSIGVPSINYNQDMTLSIVLGADAHTNPAVSKVEGYLEYLGQKQDVLVYGETIDGEPWTYTTTDGGKTWKREKNADTEDSVLNNPTAAIDLWMKHAKDFRENGVETINGFEATVYTATIGGEYVQDAMNATGGMLGGFDKDMLKELDDLPITIWVDNDSGCVVRISIDMQSMMKTLLDRALKDSMGQASENMELSIEVGEAAVVCDMSQFNAVPEIVIPDEARGNKEAPAPAPAGEGVVGTWTLSGGVGEEAEQTVQMIIGFGMKMSIRFETDGTGSIVSEFGGETESESFTYTYENGVLTIEGMEVKIEGDSLIIEEDGMGLVFTRE